MVKITHPMDKGKTGGPTSAKAEAKSPYRTSGILTMATAALLMAGTHAGDNVEARITAEVENRIEQTVKKTPWPFKGAVRNRARNVASRKMQEYVNETFARRVGYHAWQLYRAPSKNTNYYDTFYGGMGTAGLIQLMGGIFVDGLKKKRQYR